VSLKYKYKTGTSLNPSHKSDWSIDAQCRASPGLIFQAKKPWSSCCNVVLILITMAWTSIAHKNRDAMGSLRFLWPGSVRKCRITKWKSNIEGHGYVSLKVHSKARELATNPG
jgi:hypothetical protein